MLRRVLIWLLSVASAGAPLAPTWAMANNASIVTESHAATGQASTGDNSSRIATIASRTDHSSHLATNRSHTLIQVSATLSTTPLQHHAHMAHTGRGTAIPYVQDRAEQVAVGDSSADCGDGQCCGVCILTLAGTMSHVATGLFSANDSPSYRAHAYISFVPTPLGRPPQS